MSKFTDEQIEALTDAMDQLLDDMGPNGQSVCLAAKAQARVAFEPFRDLESDPDWIMDLSVAKQVLVECDG